MRDDIRDGLKKGLGISLAVLPFGLLFGALAVDNGLTPFEAVLMSGLLYAGASQMVGLELFGQNVAPWLSSPLLMTATRAKSAVFRARVSPAAPLPMINMS